MDQVGSCPRTSVSCLSPSLEHGWFISIWELDHKKSWGPKNWCFQNCGTGENTRVPWTLRRSNQSNLKEVNPEYSLEGLRLKLKLQSSGHLMQRADSLAKTLMLGKTEGRQRRGWQRMRGLNGITDTMNLSCRRWWRTGKPGALQSLGSQRVRHDLATDNYFFQGFIQSHLLSKEGIPSHYS